MELPVIIYCENVNTKIDYKQVLELDWDKIISIDVPDSVVGLCGGYNGQLGVGGELELLVRAVRYTGHCRVIADDSKVNNNDLPREVCNEQMAITYAYIVKSQLEFWHKEKLTDTLFTKVCDKVNRLGVFEQFQSVLNTFMTNAQEYYNIARETAPFMILRGDDTCGGVLQRFADDLSVALINNGQAVIKIGDGEEDYDSLANKVYKGIIGFQTKALEIDFFRKLNGPKFQFWMDFPLHFDNVLRDLPEDYHILCQDAEYAEQIRRQYNTPGAIQFSPGGIMQAWTDSERPYDIVFIGGYFPDTGEVLRGFEREYYDYMIAHPTYNFEQGLKALGGYSDEGVLSADFLDRLKELKPACRAVIGYFREKIVKSILNAGYTIHVYGEDWKQFANHVDQVAAERLVVHEHVSVAESLEELRKAKIGLNVMSWHKAGMTERIANIMLSGAVCLSDETSYLKEHFEDGENIVLFRLEKIDELPKRIGELLNNPSRLGQISRNGYDKAVNELSWDARAREIIELVNKKAASTDKLRVYVATHVPFNPPNNPIYIPLHVGREGKNDLGYIGDNTGNNISDLNYLYGELTGLFWIWQNVENVDYVGLCHYRRYFINERMKELSEDEYLKILSEYDAIVPRHAECEPYYYEHFGRAHNNKDLDAVGRALKKLYPEYTDAYDKAMNGKIFYGGNLMITSLDILKAYSEWLFNIFIEAGEDIDVSGYDAYHRRVYGFLSEQMFYVFAMANELKLYEAQVGISAEKAETKELKDMLKGMLLEGHKHEAKRLLEEQLKVRPDLLLPGSDIHDELREIVNSLYN